MSKKLKFKIGDQVRVTGDCHIGEMGVISRVKGDKFDSEIILHGWDYEVKFGKQLKYTHRGNRGTGSHVYYYYDERNLELVSCGTKYKPGDMVTVRDNLNRWDIYHMADGKNPMEATEQMLSKCGKVVKIKSVTKTGKYMIEGSIFPWVDEMFEDKPETKTDTDKSPRFKVGDKVRVRTDLERGKTYYMRTGGVADSVTYNMMDMKGKVVTIARITDDGKYRIEGNPYNWTDEMFEPDVVKSEKVEEREPKVGDRIRMTKDRSAARVGMVGTIIDKDGVLDYAVKFDKKFSGGHDCFDRCEDGYGHFVAYDEFEIIGEEKPHLICSVKFTENGKLYCYLTDDTTITVGSEVKVPVGKTDREKTATVERIGYYTEADAPYTVSEMKKVIGKATPTFDWDAFKKTKIIVKLDTKEKFDAFMEECDERGIKWRMGNRATDAEYWSDYKKDTSVVYGMYGMRGLGYQTLKRHTEELPDAVVYDYKLPESKPEVKPEPKPEPEMKRKFKVGDKVRAVTNKYVWTSKKTHWEGEVTELSDDEFCARTTKCDVTSKVGEEFLFLEYDHFELIKDESKYYNGKVVCTENKIDDKDFTVGKIYEVIDGKIVDNKTHKRPATHERLSSDFDHLSAYFEDWYYTFRPVELVTKETKLKRGDRIVMRDDLKVGEWYGLTWYPDMEHDMSGEIVTVTNDTVAGDCRVKSPKSERNWYVNNEMIAYKIID